MNAPRPNHSVGLLPRYQPGRSSEAAIAEHGLDSAIKLASNESPFGPLPGVADAVADAAARANRYADHTADAVASAYAARVGVDRACVAVGPGSVGLLEQLALAYLAPGSEVVYPWPSFIAYPQFTQLAGATAVTVPLRRHRFDADAIVDAIGERTRMVLLANPNNPTSTALTGAELARVVDAAPDDCLVVLDEAYHEFVTSPAVPDGIASFAGNPKVAVLRSLSKAYGLAGLRIGMLVADPAVVDAVNACAIPFGVSAVAQAAALAAFEQDDEVARRCAAVTAERTRVALQLRNRGIGTLASHGNFLWLPAGAQGSALAAELDRRGVVIRSLPTGVRVTIGTPEENDRFLGALDLVVGDLVVGDDPERSPLLADWGAATGGAARGAGAWMQRLEHALGRLRDHLGRTHPGRTAPVPGETETWDAGQVWAHLAEFGDYWLAELARVLDPDDAPAAQPVPFGRTRHDPHRIAAIDAGRRGDRVRQLAAVEAAACRLDALLAGMSNTDWARRGLHETLGEMDVDAQLERFHVGHYEEHADQLDSIA